MSVSRKGPLAWFAANHVASNILMIFILASGALSLLGVVIEKRWLWWKDASTGE